jgi:hypothetical protein
MPVLFDIISDIEGEEDVLIGDIEDIVDIEDIFNITFGNIPYAPP